MPHHSLVAMTIAVTIPVVLLIRGCGLPITHVHPYFGPTYGDGPG
jgi:hypothetical protein